MSRIALAFVVAASGSGVALSVRAADEARDAIVQPIEFDHSVHASHGVACADCHEGVETAAITVIPRFALCMDCHGEDVTTSPEKEKLKAFAAAKTEIPWQRLYRLPGHVVFSHERHVSMGGVACDACHGGHGTSERPPSRPEPLGMNECVACHEAKGASCDCVACHR